MRIQHAGRREFFPLTTTNQDAAARKAANIFTFLKANGWGATLDKFKSTANGEAKLDVTIGDYLGAVDATRRLRGRTLLNYRNCFHTIVAEVFGIRPKKGENKFDYRTGGNEKWTGRIDEIRLERLTPDKVERWKRDRIADAGHSPAAIAAAKCTINSYLRCARSLFSRRPDKKGNSAIVEEVQKSGKLRLPETLPFDGVGLCESGSQKYVSKINARALIAAARDELKATEPEAYKAFLLGLL